MKLFEGTSHEGTCTTDSDVGEHDNLWHCILSRYVKIHVLLPVVSP